MKKIVHYLGLDVHKDSIAVAIAPENSSEVRAYGIIGGTLEAVDRLVKKLAQENVELRFVYEAGPCGYVIHRHLKSKGIHCDVVSPSFIPKKASDRPDVIFNQLIRQYGALVERASRDTCLTRAVKTGQPLADSNA
jgi:transposase